MTQVNTSVVLFQLHFKKNWAKQNGNQSEDRRLDNGMDAMNSNYCGMDAIRQLAPKKTTFDKRQLKEIRRSNYQFNHVQRKYQMYYCSYFIQKEFDIRSREEQISTLAGTHNLQVRDREKMRAVRNAIRFIWSLVKSKTVHIKHSKP